MFSPRLTVLQSFHLIMQLFFFVLLMGIFYLDLTLVKIVSSKGAKENSLSGFHKISAVQTTNVEEILKLDKPSTAQIFEYLHWSNGTSCNVWIDFGFFLYKEKGTAGDFAIPEGNKAVCWDAGVVPTFNNCLVYSFGIRNEWSFEERMEEYGCDVFAFDPSMNVTDHMHSERVHFYSLGLLGKNYEKHPKKLWKMRTLSSIYEMLQPIHGQRIIDYLKIDIEWSEWETLPQIFQSGILTRVKQLSMDIHMNDEGSADTFLRQYKMLRAIEEDFGFYRFTSRRNLWSERNKLYYPALGRREILAFEITWYNSHFREDTEDPLNELLL